MTKLRVSIGGAMLVACWIAAPFTYGQVAVSINDGKQKMVNGVNTVTGSSERDGVTLFDFSVFPPRRIASLAMPTLAR